MVYLTRLFLSQVVEVNVKVENEGTHNVHNNAFYAEEKILKSELQAMRDCDPSSARHWIVRAHADMLVVSLLLLFVLLLLIHGDASFSESFMETYQFNTFGITVNTFCHQTAGVPWFLFRVYVSSCTRNHVNITDTILAPQQNIMLIFFCSSFSSQSG